MSIMLRDSKLVARSVFTHFSTGATYDEVLKLLLRSHERLPEFYPRIDYREVKFWYDSFENKNYDLFQEPTYPEISNLQNLAVFDKIIKDVNTEDQKSLRNVCLKTRNFINKQNRLYNIVHLSITPDSMILKTDTEIDRKKKVTVFRQVRDSCEITCDRETKESDMNYMDAAFVEFKKLVEVKHVKIKKLTITNEARVTAEHRRNFRSKIVSTLSGLKKKLHVEELRMLFGKPDELIAVLKELKTGSLNELQCRTNFEVNEPFDMKKVISSTEHWQHLKSLDCCFKVNLQLADVVHIGTVVITLNNGVAPKEFIAYKNAILQNPKFNIHEIELPSNLRERTMELASVLQPFTPVHSDSFDDETIEGKIPWPNQDRMYLIFKLNSDIQFERKRK